MTTSTILRTYFALRRFGTPPAICWKLAHYWHRPIDRSL